LLFVGRSALPPISFTEPKPNLHAGNLRRDLTALSRLRRTETTESTDDPEAQSPSAASLATPPERRQIAENGSDRTNPRGREGRKSWRRLRVCSSSGPLRRHKSSCSAIPIVNKMSRPPRAPRRGPLSTRSEPCCCFRRTAQPTVGSSKIPNLSGGRGQQLRRRARQPELLKLSEMTPAKPQETRGSDSQESSWGEDWLNQARSCGHGLLGLPKDSSTQGARWALAGLALGVNCRGEDAAFVRVVRLRGLKCAG